MLEIILPFCIFTVLSFVFTIIFICVKNKTGSSPVTLIIKSIASLMFVLGAIYALTFTSATENMIIVFGLIFAMLGDILLDLRCMREEEKKIYFNAGVGAFSASSVLYIIATILLWNMMSNFLLLALGSLLIAILIAVIIQLLEKPLKFDFTGNRIQIIVYSIFVSLAAVLGLGVSIFANGFFVFSIGLLLILISDLVLSMMYFGGKENSKILCALNHILYYSGELLVMAYLFFQLF